MSQTVKTQCLVLGSGPGGYAAAFRAADLGMQVTLVERHANLGGVWGWLCRREHTVVWPPWRQDRSSLLAMLCARDLQDYSNGCENVGFQPEDLW